MKMLYTRPSWSFVGLSDFMAPVAKFQLAGDKILIVIPFQSLSASFAATASGAPFLSSFPSHDVAELAGASRCRWHMRADEGRSFRLDSRFLLHWRIQLGGPF